MCERGLFERMKSCKEGVNNARGKKGLRGKRCKKSILKLLIEENVKRGNGVEELEIWKSCITDVEREKGVKWKKMQKK